MNENIFLKKTLIILLLCISIIFILYKTSIEFNEISIIKHLKKEKKNSTRRLLDASKVKDICEHSNKNVYEFYYNGTEYIPDETIEFNEDKEYIQALIKIIETKKPESKDIKTYIFHILPFLILLIIAVLVPIFWIGCLCCCCCNWLCCFCCCQNKFCTNLCYLFTILFLLISMILAMIGLNKYNEVFMSLNGASCSLMKFVLELSEGQEKTELPKWDGITKIKEILTDTIESIKTSQGEILNNYTKEMNNLDNSKRDWHTELEIAYTTVNQSKLENVPIPETDREESYYASYTIQYGPYTQQNTLLYSLDQEFTTIFNYLNKIKENIKTAIEEVTVSETLINAKEQLDDILSQFDDITNSIVDPWYKYQKTGVKYGKKGCKYYFYYILVVNFLLMIFFSIIFCMKKLCIFKLILHILWMTLGLILFVIMILGSVLAILGVVGKDIISVLHYTLSEKNLSSDKPVIFSMGEGTQYINTCMNGDGNLSEAFNFDISTESLNQLVFLRDGLIESFKTFENYTESINLIGYRAMLNSYERYYFQPLYSTSPNDFSNNNLFNITYYINKLNSYTIQSGDKDNCDYINDKWSLSRTDSDYSIKINPTDGTSSLGQKCLMYIYDNWPEENVQNRYNSNNLCDDSKVDNIIQYIKMFESFRDKNKELITNINTFNDGINQNFKSLIKSINTTLNLCKDIIDPIYNIFDQLIGNSTNIFSILNCSFLSTDINVTFIEIYKGLGKDIHKFGLLVYIISVFAGFGIWGILISMNLQNILDSTKDNSNKKDFNILNKNNTEKDGLKMGKPTLPHANESNIKLILDENKNN